jgi:hypothetical protein
MHLHRLLVESPLSVRFRRYLNVNVISTKQLNVFQPAVTTGCGRNNFHISKGNYKQMVRGITKNFVFPKCRYHKVFLLQVFKIISSKW